MTTIDNRVVEMRFDNKQFEEGIRKSVKSLDNLKQGLDLNAATNSLSKLDKVAKSFSMEGIASGVNAISARFSNLGIIGVTALTNITNQAVNAGKRMLSALTLDPITQGFEEYEIKMNAIQTILTNTAEKGTTLTEVNESLSELNDYADQTIYNFAQMTDNIGKFTAAGVNLKDSVSSIKGLSNLAAGFGVDAQRMAAATYQMSQAVAAGSIKLIDWNSLVQAGMGGQKTQDALKNTAKQMGVFVDESKPFRETLEQGWLSAEVFIKTMDKMAKDPALLAAATNVTTFTKLVSTMKESVASGWASTWELLIGDKNQSTAFFTGINNAFSTFIGGITDARNNVLKFWNDFGGRRDLLIGIGTILISLGNIIAPIEKALSKLIPSITGERLVYLTRKFRELTEYFAVTEDSSSLVGRIFAAFGATFTTVGSGISYVVTKFGELLKMLAPVGVYLLGIIAKVADFNVAIQSTIQQFGLFDINTYKTIGKVLLDMFSKGVTKGIEYVGKAVSKLRELLELAGISSDAIKSKFQAFSDLIASMGERFTIVKVKIKSFINAFKNIESPIGAYTASAAGANDATGQIVDNTTVFERVVNTLKSAFGKLSGVIDSMKKGISKIVDVLKNQVIYGIESITFEKVINAIETFLKFGLLLAFRDIAKAFRGLPGLVESSVKVLDTLKDSLELWQSSLKAKIILDIAIAVGILAGSIYLLATIDSEKLISATVAVGALFTLVAYVTKVLATTLDARVFASLFQLGIMIIGMSVAVSILAGAVKKLEGISWENIAKGLVVVGALLFALTKVVGPMSVAAPGLISAGLGLIGIAYALKLLVGPVAIIGKMRWQDVVKGVGSIAIIMLSLAVLARATKGTELLAASLGITAIAGAMYLFAGSVAIFGNMDVGTLQQGLLVMGGILAAITLSFVLLPTPALMLQAGLGILALSGAVNAMALAVGIFGNMDVATIEQGLITIAATLGLLVASSVFMRGTPAMAAGIAILAGSLILLMAPIAFFGNLPLEVIGIGLLAVAGSLLVLGGVAYILAPLSGVMGAISAGIALLGLAMLGIAGGVALLAASFVFLASSAVAVYAGIPLLGLAMRKFVDELNLTIPKLGDTIDLILVLFINAVPRLKLLIQVLLDAIIDLLVEYTPKIAGAFGDIIIAVANEITEHDAEFVAAMDKLDKLILRLLGDLFINILEEIWRLTWVLAQGITDALVEVRLRFSNGLRAILRPGEGYVNAAGEVYGATLGTGLVDGMEEKSKALEASSKQMMLDAVNKPKEEVLKSSQETGGNVTKGIIMGVENGSADLDKQLRKTGAGMIDALNDSLGIRSPSIYGADSGENLGAGVKEGIKKAWGGISGFLKDAGQSLIDNVNAPVAEVTKTIDKTTKDSLAKSTALSKQQTSNSTTNVKTMGAAIKTAYEKAMEWVDDEKYYGRLSLQDELKKYTEMSKTYKLTEEERKKLDRDIFRAKQDITKAEIELIRKEFQASKTWIDDRKYYNELSLNEELAAWERVQSRYILGTEERKEADREVYRLKKDLISKEEELNRQSFSRSKEWVQEQMDYDRHNLQQQLDSARRIEETQRLNFIKTGKETQEYKDAKLSTYKLTKEIQEQEDSLYKETFELQSEIREDMISREKEYLNESKQINKEMKASIKEVNAEYENAVKSRTDTIVASFGIFDKLVEETNRTKELVKLKTELTEVEAKLISYSKDTTVRDVTSEKAVLSAAIASKRSELVSIQNIQKQNRQGTKAREDANVQARLRGGELQDLTTKLEALEVVKKNYDEITAKRIQSEKDVLRIQEEMKAKQPTSGEELIGNLKDQVKELETWRANIASLKAKGLDKELLTELTSMGPKALDELKALNQLSKPQLDSYAALWLQKYRLAKTQATGELEEMRKESIAKIKSIEIEAGKSLTTLNSNTKVALDQLNLDTNTKLATLTKTWETNIGTITTASGKAFTDMVVAIKQTITNADFFNTGKNIAAGFAQGMVAGRPVVQKSAANMGLEVFDTLVKQFAIKSPSKKMFELGQFVSQGFADGLSSLVGTIQNESSTIGAVAMNAVQNTIYRIVDFFNTNTDMVPTITPVLDLSNIQVGASRLSGMLAGSSVNLARSSGNLQEQRTSELSGLGQSVNNNFSIASMVVREEADIKRVARELYQMQVATSRG